MESRVAIILAYAQACPARAHTQLPFITATGNLSSKHLQFLLLKKIIIIISKFSVTVKEKERTSTAHWAKKHLHLLVDFKYYDFLDLTSSAGKSCFIV